MILAVDPGKTTGWALSDTGYFESGQDDFDTFVARTLEWFVTETVKDVVVERYTVTAETLRKSRQTDALEVIGWLRGHASLRDVSFTLQAPGDAKRFSTDARLEELGWLRRPLAAWDHANDGARHLLLYAVKNRLMEPPRG